jgi:hypothetical protein
VILVAFAAATAGLHFGLNSRRVKALMDGEVV